MLKPKSAGASLPLKLDGYFCVQYRIYRVMVYNHFKGIYPTKRTVDKITMCIQWLLLLF